MHLNNTLTAVQGLRVGHAQNEHARTGCTVILFEPEADVACEARGGWPGTYDTHSIDVAKTFVKKHAVFLTGGDVFGFDTAVGVRRFLLERNLASATGAGKLPGIVGANIYDVEFAAVQEANYPDLGYNACQNASTEPVKEGNVGAGIGATVGKLSGMKFASKGGCGTSATRLLDSIVVGALVVTNAVGNIYDSDGKTVAGVRRPEGGFREFDEIMIDYLKDSTNRNTTIGVVATNVDLSHEQLIKVAQLGHDGLAMSIRPVHMSTDGDTLFAASTAKITGLRERDHIIDIIGYAGARCIANAVVRSAKAAGTLSNDTG
jgi:L-aminopeptidase/D-esterase-like protein